MQASLSERVPIELPAAWVVSMEFQAWPDINQRLIRRSERADWQTKSDEKLSGTVLNLGNTFNDSRFGA
jgi:hypothetical protein